MDRKQKNRYYSNYSFKNRFYNPKDINTKKANTDQINVTYVRWDIKIFGVPIVDEIFTSFLKNVNFMVSEKFSKTGVIYYLW